jgi:hypothetical protein
LSSLFLWVIRKDSCRKDVCFSEGCSFRFNII